MTRKPKSNRTKWRKEGYSSYSEWFKMRNRIWRTVWKGRENA